MKKLPSATKLIERLKKRFPNPRESADCHLECPKNKCAYCIGGILLLAKVITPKTWKSIGFYRCFFPQDELLRKYICEAFPELDVPGDEYASKAFRFAQRITRNNDLGRFDEAWGIVKEMLIASGKYGE